MKYYANLYRDSDGRGFFDNVYHTSELAKKQMVERSASGGLTYITTVEIEVNFEESSMAYDLIKGALLNAAIPSHWVYSEQLQTWQIETLDEEFYKAYLRLKGWIKND